MEVGAEAGRRRLVFSCSVLRGKGKLGILRSGMTFVDFSLVLAMLVVPFGLLLWPVHAVFRIRAVVSTWVFLECGEAHLKELRTRWIFATVTGVIVFSIGMIALVAWVW